MFLKQVQLRHFRCFSELNLDFKKHIILIEGLNGVGKTTMLEALHYLCYLRSFRTFSPRDMITFGQQTFFVKIAFESTAYDQTFQHELCVGFSGKKRLVKLNNKPIHSYKELMDFYRVITLTEDDIGLIKRGPDLRRQFMDQAILLYNPGYMRLLKEHKTVVDNRNKLLQHAHTQEEHYILWTEQLWHKAKAIQDARVKFLSSLQVEIEHVLDAYFPIDIQISFAYKPKKITVAQSFDVFMQDYQSLFEQEKRFGRSLFGAHLDDIAITFGGNTSRTYASRGQQKLIILLIKMAQLKALARQKGPALFLLDDFMADFDHERAKTVLTALTNLDTQLIFTTPTRSSILGDMLLKKGAQRVEVTG